ncbi:MAG: cytochrome P450, partial [Actinomycetota bacterium]|nr:cytochrome P450 [Actinomycetota bacterium]
MTPELSSFLDALTVADLDRDPYPVYARLRREAPVAHVPAVDTWFVTAHDDEHPDLFPAEHGQSPVEITFGTPTLITVDGPVHQDLRRSFDPN